MAWHTYEIPPIDFNWQLLRTVEETARLIGAESATISFRDDAPVGPDPQDFLASWESAKRAASDAGWEGDFRQDPVVFWLPGDNAFHWGFVIKQDNNGTTYVVSPFELPNVDALIT